MISREDPEPEQYLWFSVSSTPGNAITYLTVRQLLSIMGSRCPCDARRSITY